MDRKVLLREILKEGCDARLAEEDIYSLMTDTNRKPQYDNKAAFYDWVVGNYFYNRVMWGADPRNYAAFARGALCDGADGVALDAGCGSLLSTAEAYRDSKRPIVACDQSLEMLRRARKRLRKLNNGVKQRVILVQADVNDLPFRKGSFQTVLCMNVLHHCADARGVVASLGSLLASGGHLYVTSLVINNRAIGDWYLKRLHRIGWFAARRSEEELRRLLNDALEKPVRVWAEGNMAYATTASG